MYTKHGVLSIDGVARSVIIREATRTYGENPIVTVEVISGIEGDSCLNALKKLKEGILGRQIKDVIFNAPATIVIWADGTKTVVKCQPGDEYNRETGLAMCIAKKCLGNKGNFNEVFKKYIEGYDPREK